MSQGKLIIGNQEEFNYFLSLYNKSINENYIIISGDPYIEPINALKFYDLRKFDSFLSNLVHNSQTNYDELNHIIFCIYNMPSIISNYRFYNILSELIDDTYDISTVFKFFYNVNTLRIDHKVLSKIDDIIILKDLEDYEKQMINCGLFKGKNIIYLNKDDSYSKQKEIISTNVKPFESCYYKEKGINYFKKPNSKNNYRKPKDTIKDHEFKNNTVYNYIVVSHDKRIPEEIKILNYATLNINKFIQLANSYEGLEIEGGGIYFNIDSLTKDIYDALIRDLDGIPIVFYKFDDQDIKLDFPLKKLIVYSADKTITTNESEDKAYTIVSKDRRIPDHIKFSKISFLSQERFIKGANSEKGLDIEYDGIYFNIDSLTKVLYNAILDSIKDIPIIFYKYDDQDIKLDFKVKNLKIYKSKYSIKKTT